MSRDIYDNGLDKDLTECPTVVRRLLLYIYDQSLMGALRKIIEGVSLNKTLLYYNNSNR